MTKQEAQVRDEAALDGWVEHMRRQARRAMTEAGMTGEEIAEFMVEHERTLAAWKRERLIAVQQEREQIADKVFFGDVLEAWSPQAGDRMQ